MSIGLVGFSSKGGAGKALLNLETGLTSIGYDARSYFATDGDIRAEPLRNLRLTLSASIDSYIIKSRSWDSHVSLLRSRASEPLPNWLREKDTIIVGWSTGVFGSSSELFRDRQVIWMLPDFSPFTGFCHNNMGCEGFETGCSACPAARGVFHAAIEKGLEKKREFFGNIKNLRFLAHSEFTFENFMKSQLASEYQVSKVHVPIDELYFQPSLHAPRVTKKRIRLLIVIENLRDPLKGFQPIAQELSKPDYDPLIEIIVIGGGRESLKREYPKFRFLGLMGGSMLAREYQLADILLVPSLSETAGMVIAEAGSAGTPSIVRAGSGMTEMTNHGQGGWQFHDESHLLGILRNLDRSELERKALNIKSSSPRHHPAAVAKELSEFLD